MLAKIHAIPIIANAMQVLQFSFAYYIIFFKNYVIDNVKTCLFLKKAQVLSFERVLVDIGHISD